MAIAASQLTTPAAAATIKDIDDLRLGIVEGTRDRRRRRSSPRRSGS
jgi:hypothetical protein